ncbi:Alpha/beta hydrolase fold-1 [Penicillium digitatum]|uniref:Alpha/beta hydrolase fold-1 n=1 Tax=Penicillium digitatum TaxID=36651 RepID=A0A7T6XTM6_PENDI|nr:Alpha/beta hydrolase fold-1 [Penicillium digitatum]
MTLQGEYLTSEPDGCASVNFSDLPYAQSIQHANHMKAHSATSFAGPLQNAGYVDIPVSYIICKNDVSVPPTLQRSVIDMISKRSGREVTTLRCNSGHFPSVSVPVELASLIDRVATSS